MQGNYDDQIGGAVNQSPQDQPGGVASSLAGGISGGAGSSYPRMENDSKDVLASHMTNNQHNELNLRFGQHFNPQSNNIISFRD